MDEVDQYVLCWAWLASIQPTFQGANTGWPKEPPPLPLLLDVTLSTMGPTGFILSGIEEVDGALYAQSWWCREH